MFVRRLLGLTVLSLFLVRVSPAGWVVPDPVDGVWSGRPSSGELGGRGVHVHLFGACLRARWLSALGEAPR